MIINEELKKHIWPLKPEESQELEKSITKEGCRDPLVYAEIDGVSVLIDGHNRFEICKRNGIEYNTVLNEDITTIEQAKDWMDANQIGRRNLTADQFRISIGRRYLNEKKSIGAPEGNENRKQIAQNGPIDSKKSTAEKIANEYKVGKNTVKRYAKEAENYERLTTEQPEVAEKIRSGEATFKEVMKEQKKEERQKQIEEVKEKIEKEEIEKPSGLFDVLVIDPPWNYGREYDPEGSRVANPYPEMSQSQLLDLSIPSKPDSVLFLWTTHAFLWDAKELLDKWGYTYKATIVWDKEKMGMGAWFRMQCEFCIVGIKGKPLWNNTSYRDIVREARREHSRKPELFYKMVEEITVGRKIDLFSREKREGWFSWGAEDGKLGK